ncbi:MAG: DUF4382 domain-containing protein [Mariniphaga sp.]|nr:DUF4382 domain-containing protein [Mariniphaga sp.]
MKREKFVKSTMMLAYSIVTVQHSENNLKLFEKGIMGQVMFSLTVTPSKVTEFYGTFITISEVWLNDKKVIGFNKQTIELSAYQEGDIKLLFNGKIETGVYNSITVVFDHETDDSGDFPGSYILDENNNKICLEVQKKRSEVKFIKEIEVQSESVSEIVINTDLRKLIENNPNNREHENYRFNTGVDMANSFRISLKDECAEIKGEVDKSFNELYDMYVLAYKKGEFNYSLESKTRGQNSIPFANAVSSSKVKSYGGYQLSLLEKGEYEIHIVAFSKVGGNMFKFKGMINSTSNIPGLLLNNISVPAKSQIQLNIDIIGVI